MGNSKVVGKGNILTKISQMASIGAIFTSTYHTKQLNPWPNSLASCVVNCSWLPVCKGDMQPFEGDPSTHRRLISLKNKPQEKQPGQVSASILTGIVGHCVLLSFDGEVCLAVVCMEASFSLIHHIYTVISYYIGVGLCTINIKE